MDAPTLVGLKMFDRDLPLAPDLSQPRRAHLVGVGGNGMRAMADVLAAGDGNSAARTAMPRPFGNWPPRTCARSKATPPRICRAKPSWSSIAMPCRRKIPNSAGPSERGMPVLSYFQMLGRLTAGCHTVAIAGTHGKSTTTAMAAQVLDRRGTRSDRVLRGHALRRLFGRTRRPRRIGAGRGLRVPGQLPPPSPATCRDPGHRARSFRLLRLVGTDRGRLPAVRRLGAGARDCCWCGTSVRRRAGRRPACGAGSNRSDALRRPTGRPIG